MSEPDRPQRLHTPPEAYELPESLCVARSIRAGGTNNQKERHDNNIRSDMTTMSVVDVESIVGDMPAQACEILNENCEKYCDQTATWVARVHLCYHPLQDCWVEVQKFCQQHISEVRGVIADEVDPACRACGQDINKIFNAVRL